MCRNKNCMDSVGRFEEQTRRLRDRLADAWLCKGSPVAIRRLESMIRRRWRMLDMARRQH